MLRNAMSHAVKALRKQCFAMSETTYFSMECSYASLPDDVIAASKRARFPKRIFKEREWNGNSSEGSTTGIGTQAGDSLQASSTEASATASIDSTSVKNQNARIEAAKIASSWMFPWERRQMEGGTLRGWEKVYWGVFVTAIAVYLFNRLRDPSEKSSGESEEEIASREAEKAAQARLLLAGGTLISTDIFNSKDVFEGMEPEDIQKFCEEVTGADASDPFEGMTPDEINAYIASQAK